MRQRKALHTILTANTVLIGLLVADRLFGGVANMVPGPAEASAYGPAPTPGTDDAGGGLVSAAEQRKQIISELQNLARKLDRVDAAVRGTVNVKVTSMPKTKDDAK